jgi:hypothetical protein
MENKSEQKGVVFVKTMPDSLEKSILTAMDRCRKVVETLKSERQVDPKKLHQPFDL